MTETIEQAAYTPTNWVDDVTPVNAANLNKIEAQLASLDARTNSMELYVSGTGSDSADGLSWATAKRQISAALSLLGANGGTVWVGPGTYNPIALVNPQRVEIRGIGGVLINVPAGQIGVQIDQGSQYPLIGVLLENIQITGQGSAGGTGSTEIGLRCLNAGRNTFRRLRISNCQVGVDYYNDTATYNYCERNNLSDTLINDCLTGFRLYRTTGGHTSYSYNVFVNVAIANCPLGWDLGSVSPAVPHLINSMMVECVAWGQLNNCVGLNISGNLQGSFLHLSLEGLSGTTTTACVVGANALGLDTASLNLRIMGNWATRVSLAAGLMLSYKQGFQNWAAPGSGASNVLQEFLFDGDTQPRLRIHAPSGLPSGRISFGPGGVTAPDVTLYRNAVDVLKTDDVFDASGLGVATKSKAGTPVDGDWASGAPPSGMIVVDSTAKWLWAKIAGTWTPFGPPQLVTALPGSPTDGQEVMLTDSLTAPSYQWHMKYIAGITDGFKWMFLGGSPRIAQDEGDEQITTTTMSVLPSSGAQILMDSHVGTYDITIDASVVMATSGQQGAIGLWNRTGSAQYGTDFFGVGEAANRQGASRTMRVSVNTGSLAFWICAKSPSGAINVQKKTLKIIPHRIA